MSGRRSRDKGQRGERELAAVLTGAGFPSHRGRQYHGGPDSPDVQTALPGVHVEVKRCERLSLYAALAQAQREAPASKVPAVFHRANRKPWVVILGLEDFLSIWRTRA